MSLTLVSYFSGGLEASHRNVQDTFLHASNIVQQLRIHHHSLQFSKGEFSIWWFIPTRPRQSEIPSEPDDDLEANEVHVLLAKPDVVQEE